MPAGILRKVLHILHKSLGVSDRLHTPFQRLVAGDAQLEADVNVRDSQPGVDTRACSVTQCLDRGVNVRPISPR
jgi:hypothetical protein